MTCHTVCLVDALRQLVFSSNRDKIDQKLLKSVQAAENETEMLAELEKLMASQGELIECYSSAVELNHDMRRFKNAHRVSTSGHKNRWFSEKLGVFDLIYQISDDALNEDSLLEFAFLAIRARLEAQLEGTYEFVPMSQIPLAVETFGKAIATTPKMKLAVSSWTIDKIYEQFANLYDKTTDQNTLAELKERLVSVAKQRPPKKNPAWYSKAFKQHMLYLEALKATLEGHPLIFRPYSKTKKLVKTQPAVIRVFHDDSAKYVFRKDVEAVLAIVLRNKGQKKGVRPCSPEEKTERERGFFRTMSYAGFLEFLKSIDVNENNDMSIIEQPAVRQIGHIGTSVISPSGSFCKSALHVFEELLAELVYGLNVFNRLEDGDFEKFEKTFGKVIKECLIPKCTSHVFIEESPAEAFIRKAIMEIEPLLSKPSLQKAQIAKVTPGVGFTETVLSLEIELRKVSKYYPEIKSHISDVFLEIRRKKSNDFLKQSDMVVAVQKCLAKVFCKRFNIFKILENDDLPSSPQRDIKPQNGNEAPNFPHVRHYSEFVTEIMEFTQIDVKLRILRYRAGDERFLTNETAMKYVLVTLWNRIFGSQDAPRLRPLDDVVTDTEELQMFYVTERELDQLIDQLEIKYRAAMEEKATLCVKCEDACKSLFRIFEEEVSELLLNLETCMRHVPSRDIAIRTMSLARLDTEERTCVFAVELFEALDILIRQDQEYITATDLDLYRAKQTAWNSEDHWNIVLLPDVIDLLSRLPVDSSRLHFVPDIRDLCHLIMRPFTNCVKPFLATVESPKYTTCCSVKRIHCGAVLATVPELKDVLETVKGGSDISSKIAEDLVKSARANCSMKSWINLGSFSNTTVNVESVALSDQTVCTENPSSKQLLEIAVQAQKKYRLQLNFLKFAFKDDVEVKTLMAEEMTFGIFENFKNWAEFEEWVKSDFAMPKSGNKEAVQEWMKLSLENQNVRKIPSVESTSKPVKEEEVPEECADSAKKKSKKARKVSAEDVRIATEKLTKLLENLDEVRARSQNDGGKTLDALVEVFLEMSMNGNNQPDESTETAKLKQELSNTYADLLTLQEKYDASQKLIKDKKWEKEIGALQKSLTEKEKRIGELEDMNAMCKEDLSREVARRKEELARKDVEIQQLKDRFEQKEQQYQKKVTHLTAVRDRIESRRENRTADELDDEETIRKLRIERELLMSKNRELNRKVVDLAAQPTAANETALQLIRDGIEKLTSPRPTAVRSHALTKKLVELEEMKKKLEEEKLIGKAIKLCSAYVSAGDETPFAKEAKKRLEEYRKTYHGFKSVLNANLRMIELDVTTKLEELAPMPEFPAPFVLNLPPPMPMPLKPPATKKAEEDRDCPICLNMMSPVAKTTSCNVCHRHFHANCVSQWLVQNAICPLCRSPLPDPDEFPPLR